MNVFICPQCQKEFDKTFKFCVECGHKLEEKPGAMELLALYEQMSEHIKLLQKHYELEITLNENTDLAAALQKQISTVKSLLKDCQKLTCDKEKVSEVCKTTEEILSEIGTIEDKQNRLKAKQESKKNKKRRIILYSILTLVVLFGIYVCFAQSINAFFKASSEAETYQPKEPTISEAQKRTMAEAQKLKFDVDKLGYCIIGCNSTEKDLIIPEGITVINDGVFSNCNHDSITLPASIVNIPDGVLCGFKKVIISPENKKFAVNSAGILYEKEHLHRYYGMPSKRVGYRMMVGDRSEITYSAPKVLFCPPDFQGTFEIKGNVGDYAFFGCTGLKKIVIAGRFEIIGKKAFEGCSNLTEFVFDTKRAWRGMVSDRANIKEDAFKDTGLKEVHLPSGQFFIHYAAFPADCKVIEDVKYSNY